MSNAIQDLKPGQSTDLVLQEVWRAKDTLSAQYGHDVHRLFAEARQREELSGHPLVDPPPKRRKA